MEKQNRHVLLIFLSFLFHAAAQSDNPNNTVPFHIGVILDLGTLVGKMSVTSMSMALEDFYSVHVNYTTRLVLHPRDSKSDVIQAASNALDLMKDLQVEAIIGPQKSDQALFISGIGNKTHTPIVSFSATSPSLSSLSTPYFVRTTINDSSQVHVISSIISAFEWKNVVPVYEDTDYGRGIISFLVDALQEIHANIPYRSVLPQSASDEHVTEELYKLMTMQTRVFVVHMSSKLGIRLFSKAKSLGMMSEGYVWIMTDGLTSMLDSFDSSIISSMQGALGLKNYIPDTRELDSFKARWRTRFQKDNPRDGPIDLNDFVLRAYDTAQVLALAAEKVGTAGPPSMKQQNANNSMDLDTLPESAIGPTFLKAILEEQFQGLSGKFHLIDGQLQYSMFQLINVIERGGRNIGFWTPGHGLSRQNTTRIAKNYSATMTDLKPIIWPGESIAVPKGWEVPVNGKKLRIGVPVKVGFQEFVNVETNPLTKVVSVTGYCIDVFEEVLKMLPYSIPHEYIPFEDTKGESAGSYNDLVDQVYLQKYDAVVGDVTIRGNRSLHVDFTLPYTESGVAMLVPVYESTNKNAWIFLKPLSLDLWLGSLVFFIYTGFVVWLMEHRINTDFRGPCSEQLGTIFYFSFSTLVFSHREKLENVLSKIVLIIWLFVVLILTSSYTACLASMLTVEQLQPAVSSIDELLKSKDYVGYHKGSFIEDLLIELHFDKSRLRTYDADEYADALSRGSKNGGVSAIIHEIPYIKFFLANPKNCAGYTMVGPLFKTAGFGFVFPKGSPLVQDVSGAILNVIEGNILSGIEKKWFGDETTCLNKGSTLTGGNLTWQNFGGLFLITGTTSTLGLFVFLCVFFCKNWNELKKLDPDKPIWKRIVAWLKYGNKMDSTFYKFKKDKTIEENGSADTKQRQTTLNTSIEASAEATSELSSNISNLSDVDICPQYEEPLDIASPSPSFPIVPIQVAR